MGGLWRKLWWRALCVVGLVVLIDIALPLMMIAKFVVFNPPAGPLDFAGGSVVHVGPLPLLLLPWLAVEFYNLRRELPVPFGSYAAFAVAFAASLQMTVDSLKIQPFIAFALATGAGLAAGWTYARLTRERARPELRI